MKNTLKLKQKNAPSTTLERDVLEMWQDLKALLPYRSKDSMMIHEGIVQRLEAMLICANILRYELE